MLRGVSLLALGLLAACYRDPSLASCKYRCGGATNESCPSGFDCVSGYCVTNGDTCREDGGVIDADVPNDAPPDTPLDTPPCVGMGFDTTALVVGATPRSLVAYDVDGNTFPDLVVVDNTAAGGAGVFRNMNGTDFDSRVAISNTTGAVSVARGDVDDDNLRDDVFVLKSSTPNTASMRHAVNTGNGTFGGVSFTLSSSNNPGELAVADIDGDGIDDYAVHYLLATHIAFRRHRPLPDDDWKIENDLPIENGAKTFTLATINSGAQIDVVVVYDASDKFMFYSGTSAFQFGSGINQVVGDLPVDVAVGRLVTTGGLSVVTANALGDSVSIRHNTGTVSFSSGGDPLTGNEPVAVILADLNNDQLLDIVTANKSGNSVSVLLNNGTGFATYVEFPAGAAPIDVVAADFDKDGRMDLAVANSGSNDVSIMYQRCM
ncbi:MAG: FG-GAP repeat domain-containing protein [Kofleriaceae bacterium]